jgi:hypothetical protein
MNKRKPAFLIIGAARCGTSSLHRNLCLHPQIEGPSLNRIKGNNKEIHYFDKKWGRGLDWYLDCWQPSNPNTLLMESTPNYLYHPRCPEAIQKDLPDCKFIVLLRNPVDRAWSHFYHWKYSKNHCKNWELSRLNNPNDEIIQKGVYIRQLLRWHHSFPKEQFLIIRSEDFFKYERQVISKVFEWLGVKIAVIDAPIYYDPVYNNRRPVKDHYSNMPKELKGQLVNYYKHFNKQLYEYLGHDFGWEKAF